MGRNRGFRFTGPFVPVRRQAKAVTRKLFKRCQLHHAWTFERGLERHELIARGRPISRGRTGAWGHTPGRARVPRHSRHQAFARFRCLLCGLRGGSCRLSVVGCRLAVAGAVAGVPEGVPGVTRGIPADGGKPAGREACEIFPRPGRKMGPC
jgi:hypothetical protein